MPTKFFLPSTGAAAVSPAFAAWDQTGEATRRAMARTRISSAMANSTITDGTLLAGQKHLWRQYVSEPISAQTISGTFKGQLRTSEASALLNHDRVTLVLKVVSNDGATLRGTLLSLNFYGSTNEYTVEPTRTNRKMADGDTLSSVAAQANDRIVLEVGTQASSTPVAVDEPVHAVFGDDSATDLAEDETATAANNPWIEFSGTIAFDQILTPATVAGIGAAILASLIIGPLTVGGVGGVPPINTTIFAAATVSGAGTVPLLASAGVVAGSYSPTAPTSLARGMGEANLYIMRASGNQGDQNDATGTTAVTPASWPTGTGVLVIASQAHLPKSLPEWPIVHLVFVARGLLSADSAGYLSNLRIDGWGGSVAISPTFPIKVPYVGPSGFPGEVREARSAPVTICPPTGNPWRWIDVDAIVALALKADHANITTAGHFAEGYGTELWIEAYGPQGSNNNDIAMTHRVARTIVMESELQIAPIGG